MLAPEIIVKIESNNSDANGRHCNYYQINDREGLKLWNDEKQRDDAYDMQSYCHGIGLAPYVGTKVEIATCENIKYGYVTEHLTVVTQELDTFERKLDNGRIAVASFDDCVSRYKLNSDEYFDAIHKAWDKVHELKDRYKEFGVIYDDATLFNTGIMSNGEYCAIDFGDFRKEMKEKL